MCEKLYESIKRNLAQGGITQLGFREGVHVAAALTQPPNLPLLCLTILCTTGADPGGTPKLHKEWINVARMRANTLRFSTQQLPGPLLFPKSCIRPCTTVTSFPYTCSKVPDILDHMACFYSV